MRSPLGIGAGVTNGTTIGTDVGAGVAIMRPGFGDMSSTGGMTFASFIDRGVAATVGTGVGTGVGKCPFGVLVKMGAGAVSSGVLVGNANGMGVGAGEGLALRAA